MVTRYAATLESFRAEIGETLDNPHLLYPIATNLESSQSGGWSSVPPVFVEQSDRLFTVRYFTLSSNLLFSFSQKLTEDSLYDLVQSLRNFSVEVQLPSGYVPKKPEIKPIQETRRRLVVEEGLEHVDGIYIADTSKTFPIDLGGYPFPLHVAREVQKIVNENTEDSPSFWLLPNDELDFYLSNYHPENFGVIPGKIPAKALGGVRIRFIGVGGLGLYFSDPFVLSRQEALDFRDKLITNGVKTATWIR